MWYLKVTLRCIHIFEELLMSFKQTFTTGWQETLCSVFTTCPLSVYGVLSVFCCLSPSTGPPRMSPKSQRTPRAHRVPPCRTSGVSPGVDLISHSTSGEVPVTPPTRSNSSGGTWSSVVSGGKMVLFLFIMLRFLWLCCVRVQTQATANVGQDERI